MSSSRNQQHHNATFGLIGFGATVAVGLATLAWYAGKKLTNAIQREAPLENCGSAPPGRLSKHAPNRDKTSRELLRDLRAYYDKYVDITDLPVIRHVVQDVRMEVFDYFRVNFPDLLLFDVLCQSDDLEGLHAVKVGPLDLLLVLGLNGYEWELQKSDADDLRCDVSRIASGLHGSSLALIDSCVVNGKLSPVKVAEFMFRDFCENFTSSDDAYQFTPVVKESKVSLNVSGHGTLLVFNLTPAIHLRDVLLTASTSETADTWQESLFEREIQKLNRFDARYCCHLKCIQILKAVSLDHPAEFGFLNPEIYKSIVLEMMGNDPDAWSHDNLANQFTSVLNMLVFYLASKKAPHPLIPKMNLLQKASDEACNVLIDLISSCVAEDKIHTLLQIK